MSIFRVIKHWKLYGFLFLFVLFVLYQYLKPAELALAGTTVSDEVLFRDVRQICQENKLDGSSISIAHIVEGDKFAQGLKPGEKYLQISSNYAHWWQDDKVPYEVYTAFATWQYLSERTTETPFNAIHVIYRPRSIVQVRNAYVFLTREDYMKIQSQVNSGDPISMARTWMDLTHYKLWYQD